jgi:hypothetical protein
MEYKYVCSKCAYKTNKKANLETHMKRKIPCDRNLNEEFVKQQMQDKYYKSLDEVVELTDMIEDMDADELIDSKVVFENLLKNILKYSTCIDNFSMEDYDELSEVIYTKRKNRRLELLS